MILQPANGCMVSDDGDKRMGRGGTLLFCQHFTHLISAPGDLVALAVMSMVYTNQLKMPL